MATSYGTTDRLDDAVKVVDSHLNTLGALLAEASRQRDLLRSAIADAVVAALEEPATPPAAVVQAAPAPLRLVQGDR